MALNHVALTVSDRERSADFYAEHFALTERIHDDPQLLIVADRAGSVLALAQGKVPDGLPRTNHFGFQVSSPDEVRAARDQMRAAGVRETEWQDDPGMVRVQVSDPDGYRVDLFAIASEENVRRPSRSRWTSFVADPDDPRPRILSEHGNPRHRLRVEHNRDTLLIHLSGENGDGWTVFAVDRASREWAAAQADRQLEAAERAFEQLYGNR